MAAIHVFVGTAAEQLKIAPLLWEMDARGVPYRLIDSAQHASFGAILRSDLDLREPDVRLPGDRDVRTLPQALVWGASAARRLWSGRRIRDEIFGGEDGVVVVHGDTLSTILGALMARRAGLRVAHVESGLRSGSFLDPFPEEAIRTYVPRVSALLFPPGPEASANLDAMGVRGRIVETTGNTIVETLRGAVGDDPPPPGSGPVLMQLHRQENLRSRSRLGRFVDLACRLATDHPVRFVLHGATQVAVRRRGLVVRLRDAGVETSGLLPRYTDFARLLYGARFVVADGASLQEECAAIGVPTLLWRTRTERRDGIGRNVVLSRLDEATIEAFIAAPERHRHPPAWSDERPSREIVSALREEVGH